MTDDENDLTIRVTAAPLSEVSGLREDVQNEVLDALDGGIYSPEKANVLVTYFTVASTIVEKYSAELLYHHVLAEGHKGNESMREFFENISQAQRRDLLFDSGVIDSGLKGEMKKTRRLRNRLVHDRDSKMSDFSKHELEDKVDSAYRVVKNSII